MNNLLLIILVLILPGFINAQEGGYNCLCPDGRMELGEGEIKVIQSQRAGCNMDCTVTIENLDPNYVIHFKISTPSNYINITVEDGNGQNIITQNCGTLCYANTSIVTVTFIPAYKGADVNNIAEVEVGSVLSPYTTSTMTSSTTGDATSTNNAFFLHNYKIAMLVFLVAIKSMLNLPVS